jgi:hypothetical protein
MRAIYGVPDPLTAADVEELRRRLSLPTRGEAESDAPPPD